MLAVTHLGSDSKIAQLIGGSALQTWVLTPAWIITSSSDTTYKTGNRPVVHGKKNFVGDNACRHENVKGEIFIIGDERVNPHYPQLSYSYLSPDGVRHTIFVPVTYLPEVSFLPTDLWLWGNSQRRVGPKVLVRPYYWWESGYVQQYELSWTFIESNLLRYCQIIRTWDTSGTYLWSTYYSTVLYELDPTTSIERMSQAREGEWWSNNLDRSNISLGDWGHLKPGSAYSVGSGRPVPPFVKINARAIAERFWHQGDWSTVIPQERFTWGDLAQQAADSTKYVDCNTPAYLADFFKAASLIEPLKGFVNGASVLKTAASGYLAYHYGVKLTIKDSREISKAILQAQRMVDALPFQVSRSRASAAIEMQGYGVTAIHGIRTYNFKLYYNPADNAFKKILHDSLAWDYYPTPSNIWDFIPFSFVVDWFVGVQDQLERMEHSLYISTLDVLGCIQTTKDTYTVPAGLLLGDLLGCVALGDIEMTLYNRELTDVPPQPISRFDVSKTYTHWVEGAALLLQK